MNNDYLVLIVGNSVLLLALLLLVIRLVRTASKYTYAIGDFEKQTALKHRLLLALVLMVVISLFAAVFNIVLA